MTPAIIDTYFACNTCKYSHKFATRCLRRRFLNSEKEDQTPSIVLLTTPQLPLRKVLLAKVSERYYICAILCMLYSTELALKKMYTKNYVPNSSFRKCSRELWNIMSLNCRHITRGLYANMLRGVPFNNLSGEQGYACNLMT